MPTLREIAAAAGVSISTASRALADHEYVNDATRERVKAAARELGYSRHATASRLRRSKTGTIGFLTPDMRNSSFSSQAAVFLQRELQEYGYGMVTYVSKNDRETEIQCLERLRDQEVDGVIHVASSTISSEFLAEGPRPIPVVEMFRQTSSTKLDAVVYDDAIGSATLMEHLLNLGHRRIGVLAGPARLESTRRRIAGAQRAAEEAGLDPGAVRVAHAPHNPEAGRLAFEKLVREEPRVTAVLATSTQFVLGAALAARQLGVEIPNQLSLAGFGDPEWNQLISPSVTAFTLPLEEMAMTAALMMVSRIERGQTESRPTRIVFSGTVIPRGSTAAPASGVDGAAAPRG